MIKTITEIQKIEKYKNILREDKPQKNGCYNCIWKKEIQKIEEKKNKGLRNFIITAFRKIECWNDERSKYLKRQMPFIQDVDYLCRFYRKESNE